MANRATLTLVLGGAALLAGLLLLIDFGIWIWVTDRMQRELAAWEATQQQYGLHISHAEPARAGWPFAAGLLLRQVSIATEAPQTAEILAWQADQVVLGLSLLHPETLVVEPSDAQRLIHGQAPPLAISARLRLRLPLAGGPGSAEASRLRVTLPGGLLAVGHATIGLAGSHLAVALQDVTVPVPDLPFGGSIASASVDGSTTTPIPSAPDLATAAAAWREAGGRLLLEHASVHWGPLDAEGSATLSLDAALQPVATATLRLTGYSGLIDALTRAGAITRNDARVAATLLGLMAHTPPDAASYVDLPLTLQDGRLAAGAIPLARIPRLVLP